MSLFFFQAGAFRIGQALLCLPLHLWADQYNLIKEIQTGVIDNELKLLLLYYAGLEYRYKVSHDENQQFSAFHQYN